MHVKWTKGPQRWATQAGAGSKSQSLTFYNRLTEKTVKEVQG